MDSEGSVRIETDDLSRDAVRALLAEHLADMHATSPVDSVHALDVTGLTDSSVTMWTLWSDGDELLGCVALKERSSTGGEIKSMRTSSAARGRGVGTRLLQHVVDESRQRGYRQLELETGTQDFFAPARRLYARFGFVPCPPFGNYHEDPNSAFFVLAL